MIVDGGKSTTVGRVECVRLESDELGGAGGSWGGGGGKTGEGRGYKWTGKGGQKLDAETELNRNLGDLVSWDLGLSSF